MTLLNDTSRRCQCGHGPWTHRILAFRKTEGQLLKTIGICSGGACECQNYEQQGPHAAPQGQPRRFAPLRRKADPNA